MDSFESQLSRLQSKYAGATVTRLDSGSHMIVIPEMPTRGRRWSARSIEIRFVAPPYSGWPTNFWAYPDLLIDGQWPHHSFGGIGDWLYPSADDAPFGDGKMGRSNPMPGCPGFHGRWFSMRPQSWNQNRDSLLIFAKMIEIRLQDDRSDREFNDRLAS